MERLFPIFHLVGMKTHPIPESAQPIAGRGLSTRRRAQPGNGPANPVPGFLPCAGAAEKLPPFF
jgi:hypothetical protein